MKRYFAILILTISAVLVAILSYSSGTRIQHVSKSGHDANLGESLGKVAAPPAREVKPNQVGKPTHEFFSGIPKAPEIQAGSREQLNADRQDLDLAEGAAQRFNAPGATRTRALQGDLASQSGEQSDAASAEQRISPRPIESRMVRAGSFSGDVRTLPYKQPVERFKPEFEGPEFHPRFFGTPPTEGSAPGHIQVPAVPAVAAPTPILTFDGLDRFTWGSGSPPDTNGDVGPNHYVQTVNSSIGIFNKTTGAQTAALTFDTLMSQGNFGNLCDTENFGDPVVLYDTFEDRWIVTDFAFLTDINGDVLAPAFQCFAASKTGDPVAGGWNFYSIQVTDLLGDYPKFAIWPDGLYMSANMFTFGAGASNQGVRVWAFNKAQMYAGAPSVQNVSFNVAGDFTVIPSNARLQTGTPPTGTPNYFLSSSNFLNALAIYKFHADWDRITLSTFTGPDIPIAATSWPNAAVADVAQPGTATLLDTLSIRAMVQNQYTNFGGTESLWVPHTVRRADVNGLAAPRWYQVNVTGGTVAANLPQAATWDPDGANVINRFMPSLALDRAGNMALGYSTSSGSAFPSIKYAGRLAADPVNTLSLTETSLFNGTASQTGSTRWGDYSGMTVDTDGCTFWYTNEYANPADQTSNHRWLTRIGKFKYDQCTTIGNGTLQGTVTVTPGGAPISGATVSFGARTTTTNGSGFYSFAAIPAGTYPTETASNPGFASSTTTNIVINQAATTVKDFALAAAPQNSCLTDTTQPDFQLGVPASTDLTTSPGNVRLTSPDVLDQQNTDLLAAGFAFTTTWHAQTFTAGITGSVSRVDLNLFSLNCGAVTMPDLTVSIRNAASNLPTGADLGTATIPGFCNGGGGFFTATFATPVAVTAGTQYAIVWRSTLTGAAVSPNPRYVSTVSDTDPYAGGRRATSTTSGASWTGAAGINNNDFGFKVYVNNGFTAAGNLVSGLKDSNPGGITPYPHWFTMSWNATVPANTTLRFQAAGSNSQFGPFNFVGPDGTAATFFTTSPANVTQFNGNRYLKYKAFLTTSNGAASPTLNDVTLCFNNTSIPTAAEGVVSGQITNSEGAAVAGAVIQLNGTQNRKFITDADGNYRFDNVETTGFYTVTPSLGGYHFSPENRSFSALGNNTNASFTAIRDMATGGNAIDTPEYFVRQHYLDFLGREPDESGFNFWSDQIISCGADAGCAERRTINVSAAYFFSIEFSQTGGLVDGLYRASFGRRPTFTEFMPDTALVARNVIVGKTNWAQILEENKQAFIDAWLQRPAFQSAFGGLTDAAYVDALISHTGVSFSQNERDALVNGLANGASTRAQVLRQIAENETFVAAKRNERFVMMQYFGYLRREPDADGFAYWLNKLNQFNGNFEQAEMVRAFLVSTEYRRRFAQ